MFYKLSFSILLISAYSLTANANFNFNGRCVEAYKDIFHLKLNDARSIIREEKKQSPQNGVPILLDNYIDYVNLLMSDNKADYERLKDYQSDRIDELENNDKNSPYFLYAQAEVYLQWGIVKAKFGDYFSSFSDLKKARSLLKENTAKYPDFLPDQKDAAIIDVILGALPSNLKSITKLLGMSGNVQSGISRLEKLRAEIGTTKFTHYKDELTFSLCYMHLDVLHTTHNYDRLMLYVKDMDNSTLRDYLSGYVAAKNGYNDEAIECFMRIQIPPQQFALPTVNYMLGYAKLCRRDSDANLYLLRYIKEYKGSKYIKDAYLKLAYYYLLDSDVSKYNYYLNMVRNNGYLIDEKDKQALREANDSPPDADLLKARLYYDGGYYNKALAQLKNKQLNDFKLLRDRVEYIYRLGRVYEKTAKLNEAIASYQKAISLGKSMPYYYAANAALGAGHIFEEKKDYNTAAYYYNQALDMKNHEYQNSTEYEAKQGLERIHH